MSAFVVFIEIHGGASEEYDEKQIGTEFDEVV